MGDFNDTPDSEPIHAVVGDTPFRLLALRPLDSTGSDGTHFWRARGEFSRIDYLITSPGMSNEYVPGSAHIADVAPWKDASDHRMIYASFLSHDVGTGAASQAQNLSRETRLLVIAMLVVAVLLVVWVFLDRRRRTGRNR